MDEPKNFDGSKPDPSAPLPPLPPLAVAVFRSVREDPPVEEEHANMPVCPIPPRLEEEEINKHVQNDLQYFARLSRGG